MLKWERFALAVSAVLLVFGAGSICADVTFTRDVIIASGDDVSSAHVKINVYDVGQVDLAWRDTAGNARYTNVSNGAIVVDGEGGLPYAHHIMGISRYGSMVRIGMNSNKNVQQYIRLGAAAWILRDTGHNAEAYEAPSGGYDVDPCTGLGGFLFKEDVSNDIVYVHQTAPMAWSKTVLESNVSNSGFGRYGDLVYTATGDPIGAYKTYDASIPGGRVRGGMISGPGALTTVNIASPGQHVGLTVVPDGTIYMLDDYDARYTFLMRSVNGTTWSYVSAVQDSPGSGGDNEDMDVVLAVAPDKLQMAALLLEYNLDAAYPLMLYISENGGGTWNTQVLPGAVRGIPDVAFDAAGNLYVVYYDSDADELHLLTNEPASNCQDIWSMGHGIRSDLNHDCRVNMLDLAVFMNEWLQCVEPGNVTCGTPWIE